jgi:hypothetical protein
LAPKSLDALNLRLTAFALVPKQADPHALLSPPHCSLGCLLRVGWLRTTNAGLVFADE